MNNPCGGVAQPIHGRWPLVRDVYPAAFRIDEGIVAPLLGPVRLQIDFYLVEV